MVVLDTDHISLLERGNSRAARDLLSRLSKLPPEEVATTIISYEEQTRGWFAYMAKAHTVPQQIEAYRRLLRHLENYRTVFVVPFDEAAAVVLQDLRRMRVRVGTMDLRIAAIVLSRGATLLSRNLADFRKVPGIRVEDWTTGQRTTG
jgi:tRNA(fMet)-specific endonuclease VapC